MLPSDWSTLYEPHDGAILSLWKPIIAQDVKISLLNWSTNQVCQNILNWLSKIHFELNNKYYSWVNINWTLIFYQEIRMLSLEQDFTKRQLYLDEVCSCLGKYGSSQTLFLLITKFLPINNFACPSKSVKMTSELHLFSKIYFSALRSKSSLYEPSWICRFAEKFKWISQNDVL